MQHKLYVILSLFLLIAGLAFLVRTKNTETDPKNYNKIPEKHGIELETQKYDSTNLKNSAQKDEIEKPKSDLAASIDKVRSEEQEYAKHVPDLDTMIQSFQNLPEKELLILKEEVQNQLNDKNLQEQLLANSLSTEEQKNYKELIIKSTAIASVLANIKLEALNLNKQKLIKMGYLKESNQ